MNMRNMLFLALFALIGAAVPGEAVAMKKLFSKFKLGRIFDSRGEDNDTLLNPGKVCELSDSEEEKDGGHSGQDADNLTTTNICYEDEKEREEYCPGESDDVVWKTYVYRDDEEEKDKDDVDSGQSDDDWLTTSDEEEEEEDHPRQSDDEGLAIDIYSEETQTDLYKASEILEKGIQFLYNGKHGVSFEDKMKGILSEMSGREYSNIEKFNYSFMEGESVDGCGIEFEFVVADEEGRKLFEIDLRNADERQKFNNYIDQQKRWERMIQQQFYNLRSNESLEWYRYNLLLKYDPSLSWDYFKSLDEDDKKSLYYSLCMRSESEDDTSSQK